MLLLLTRQTARHLPLKTKEPETTQLGCGEQYCFLLFVCLAERTNDTDIVLLSVLGDCTNHTRAGRRNMTQSCSSDRPNRPIIIFVQCNPASG